MFDLLRMCWITSFVSVFILWKFDGVWCKDLEQDSMGITTTPHQNFYDFLSKIPSSLRKRDLWELVSASSDVVPIRSSPSQEQSSSFLTVQMRLQKLQYYFNSLKIAEEDCRQRLLCELAQDPAKFSPLSSAFLDETRYQGEKERLAIRLMASDEGARLLTYIEASERGSERQGCEVWTYRCPQTATSMINYKSLLLWREMSKWLTVKMVAKRI